ncbi:GntR family transcriptional regulator [Pseudoroseomonas globiformis]|uniref:GntR family transcriptional regulator n=1 Tax=Teichococcus globiformis TaxID=2307229 RepID=A0ABV7G848_9PROT
MTGTRSSSSESTLHRVRGLEIAIAQDIQAGHLPAGAWLKQVLLQQRYGHSRGDVRRALDRLVAQHLVQHVPNCGYRVQDVDEPNLLELRQLRAILENAAAAMTTVPAPAEALVTLRRLADAFSTAAAQGSVHDRNETNLAFHQALLNLCPNRELAHAVMRTRLRMPAAPGAQWAAAGWVSESARQHHAMVDALSAGDRAAFCAAVRAHQRPPPPQPVRPAPGRQGRGRPRRPLPAEKAEPQPTG